jgi:hypothetical protein
MTQIKKRVKYQHNKTHPPESLEYGNVVGIIKKWGQHQHLNSYNIEFKFKTFKKIMLPLAQVVPFPVDEDVVAGLFPPTDETDRNRTSHLLYRVTDSEQGMCPESGDEGYDVDLSNEDNCVRIIADSENFTWHRRKQGDFAFMDQDTEDDVPALRDDEVMQDLTLNWVEEGTLPDPKDKIKDTPGCLRKGREKNCGLLLFLSCLIFQ